MDIATILGIVVAIGSIIGGQALEGGHLSSILQLTAFIIVAGGTLGACYVQNPLSVVIKALTVPPSSLPIPRMTSRAQSQILDLANVARKQGYLH